MRHKQQQKRSTLIHLSYKGTGVHRICCNPNSAIVDEPLFVEWLLGWGVGGGQLELKVNSVGYWISLTKTRLTNLRAELAFNPVEVVVQITSLHQVTTPSCKLSNDPCCLIEKERKTGFLLWKKAMKKLEPEQKPSLKLNFYGEGNMSGEGNMRTNADTAIKAVNILQKTSSTSMLKGLMCQPAWVLDKRQATNCAAIEFPPFQNMMLPNKALLIRYRTAY